MSKRSRLTGRFPSSGKSPCLAALFSIFVLAAQVPQVFCQSLPEGAQREIDALFEQWSDPSGPGASILVARGSDILYEKGYGSANLEHSIPNSPETIFLIASISKQFTAYAIAMLADEGRLSLDDDIRVYVPEIHEFDDTITIRHLIHHISGLRDEFDLLGMAGWRMDDVITHEAILHLVFAQTSLNFTPGEKYLYSNTGYTLLAEIVQRITKQSFREWMKENVFDPLGMDRTHIHDAYREIVPDRAQGYEPDVTGGHHKQIYSYQNFGSTGVFTTARDLAKWLHNFDKPVVGSRRIVEQVYQRGILNAGDTLSYAFGLRHGEYHGHRRISHSGWHRGFRSVAYRFPDDSLSIIVLANTNGLNPSEKGLEIADLFFRPSELELAEYAGTYRSEDLDTSYEIRLENGHLRAFHVRNDPFDLTWDGPDTFTTDAEYFDNIVFSRSESVLTGFEGTTKRTIDVSFTRINLSKH